MRTHRALTVACLLCVANPAVGRPLEEALRHPSGTLDLVVQPEKINPLADDSKLPPCRPINKDGVVLRLPSGLRVETENEEDTTKRYCSFSKGLQEFFLQH